MDLNFSTIIDLAKTLGLPGVVLLIWYFDARRQDQVLRQYREDMVEQRRMYENNVELVKVTQALAADQKDVLLMTTQQLTRVRDSVESNQFCPMVRLKKNAQGVQE